MTLGEALKILRGTMSLREASEKTGVSHTYLDRLEKGFDPRSGKDISPSPAVLKSIAFAYNVPYETLMALAGYLDQFKDSEDPQLKDMATIYPADKHELLQIALLQQGNRVSQNPNRSALIDDALSRLVETEPKQSSRDRKDLKKLLEESELMFDGVPLTDEDKAKVEGVLEGLFWEAKQMNKRKKKSDDK